MDGKIFNCEVVEVHTNTKGYGKQFFKKNPPPLVGEEIITGIGNNSSGYFVTPNLLGEPWVLTQWAPEDEYQALMVGLPHPCVDKKGQYEGILWQLVLKVIE